MASKTIAVPKGGGSRSFAQWKQFFFDREAVKKRLGPATARGLSKFGAYVRRVAQTSMRYRKQASAAGQPPTAHKDKKLAALKKMKRSRHNGALLREFLYFAYDPSSGTVVVGPQGFGVKGGGLPVPALHEEGGAVAAGKRRFMVVKNKPGRDERGKFVSAGERLVRLTGTLRYPKRPYMKPALDRTAAKFADSFKATLTR